MKGNQEMFEVKVTEKKYVAVEIKIEGELHELRKAVDELFANCRSFNEGYHLIKDIKERMPAVEGY